MILDLKAYLTGPISIIWTFSSLIFNIKRRYPSYSSGPFSNIYFSTGRIFFFLGVGRGTASSVW